MTIRFIHLGKPVPKGGLNAKAFPSGKVGLFYPAHVKRAEKSLAAEAQKAMQESGWPMIGARCMAHIRFYLKPTKTGKLNADLDKLVRLVFDALTGVVWEDDMLVQSLTTSKHPLETSYAGNEVGLERTEVSVTVAG